MRLLGISYVKDGDIVAKNIYDTKLNLLVSAGRKLDGKFIEKLKSANITYVYIDDEISKGIEIDSIVDDTFKLRTVNILKKIYDNQMENQEKLITISDLEISDLKDLIDGFIDDIYSKRDKKYFSTDIMGQDMYTYNHCIEVSILSLKIGHHMGLDRERLNRLGIGALLSDIGKSKVPKELINKKGVLEPSEFEEVKKHVLYGYNMIKGSVNLTPHSKQIVYMHHEKLDGSGYPEGFKGENIPLMARIVAVADIFDAIASDRTYSNRRSVGETVEILRTASGTKLDSDVLTTLNSVVEVYPPGTLVQLTDGSTGIVKANNSSPTRPIVGIIKDGAIIEELNMMEVLTVFIKSVLQRI